MSGPGCEHRCRGEPPDGAAASIDPTGCVPSRPNGFFIAPPMMSVHLFGTVTGGAMAPRECCGKQQEPTAAAADRSEVQPVSTKVQR